MTNERVGLFRVLAQILVGLFFFWHVAAIGTYAIPIGTEHDLAKQGRAFLTQKFFTPYILTLSQWQQWNLFSPDPMRRVSRYRIEKWADEQWQAVEFIMPGSYEWWRHATHFKMHISMLEKDQETYHPDLLRHFVLMRCAIHNLPSGTPLRLTYIQYILSRPTSPIAALRPDPWPPNYSISHTDPYYCP
jgi:hypothetical protein